MALRRTLFPAQRPFKFHYYNISSFVRPDQDWELDPKQRVRKCKHLLVALDEFREPVSQTEYRQQLLTFADHLTRLLPDQTFPIWFFSVNESPMLTRNCHTPTLPRTTDHPCNDVLKDLFHPDHKRTNFRNPRFHFLDNTDLTLPNIGVDALSVIALRVFVLVGRGVTIWRHMGQHGLIDGLHKNDTVEPNPEYYTIPYEGWSR
jgi:hypothetical protein